jgi:hypothetical protein
MNKIAQGFPQEPPLLDFRSPGSVRLAVDPIAYCFGFISAALGHGQLDFGAYRGPLLADAFAAKPSRAASVVRVFIGPSSFFGSRSVAQPILSFVSLGFVIGGTRPD